VLPRRVDHGDPPEPLLVAVALEGGVHRRVGRGAPGAFDVAPLGPRGVRLAVEDVVPLPQGDVVPEPHVGELVGDELRGEVRVQDRAGVVDRPGLGLQPPEPELVHRHHAAQLGERVRPEHRLHRPHPGGRGPQRSEGGGPLVHAELLGDGVQVGQTLVQALLDLVLPDGEEVQVGGHRLPGDPVPGVEVLLAGRVRRLQPTHADRLHPRRHPDRDVHQRRVGGVVVGREPPRRALGLPGHGPLLVGGPPRTPATLPKLTRLARVVDLDPEVRPRRDRRGGRDLHVAEAVGVERRRLTVDQDPVCTQGQVEVEAPQGPGGLGVDGGGRGDALAGHVPVQVDDVLGDLIAAVAGVRIVGVVEAGVTGGGLGLDGRGLRRLGPGPTERQHDAPGGGEEHQQGQGQHDDQRVRHRVRPLPGRFGGRSPAWVNARHGPGSGACVPGARPRRPR